MRLLESLICLGLLLSLLQLEPTFVGSYNYCHNESSFCAIRNLDHFMCTEMQPLLNITKFVVLIPETYKFRSIILSYMNKHRNEVAGGTVVTNENKTLKPASRMRELIWDEELGYLARSYAKRCTLQFTKCRGVSRFPWVNEFNRMLKASSKRRTLKNILDQTVGEAFKQAKIIKDPDSSLCSYKDPEHRAWSGFAVMALDVNSRVGCAVAIATGCTLEDPEGYCHFLSCFFDNLVIRDSNIYVTGEPASECDFWQTYPSGSYRNLCHNTGRIIGDD